MRIGMSRSFTRLDRAILLGSIVLLGIGCGGGGGGGGSGSGSGSGGGGSSSGTGSTVNVSLASAPAFPAGTLFPASTAAVEETAKPVSPGFDNVFVKIVKVALLPAKEGEAPDPDGEAMTPDDDPDRNGAHVSVDVDPPRVIDLLHLPSGRKFARFLDRFVDVPAGTYGKIRVYYSNLWGVRGTDEIPFHPTANSHFDVHFVDGDLVIPVAPDPDRGVHIVDVTIHFVGLKIVENRNKVLMRPQVFALLDDVLFGVSGRAANLGSAGFDIVQDDPGLAPVRVTYTEETFWSFEDAGEGRRVNDVGTANGTAALRVFTKVEAIGMFSGEDLVAREIILSFEDVLQGTVVSGSAAGGWTVLDTLELNLPPDNAVFPKPSRTTAVFDDAASPGHELLVDADVVQGSAVKARGYFLPGTGIEAFWISVSGP